MEDIGLDYSLYLHEMYISCCLKRASHVARDVHLMQMDYRVEDGRGYKLFPGRRRGAGVRPRL